MTGMGCKNAQPARLSNGCCKRDCSASHLLGYVSNGGLFRLRQENPFQVTDLSRLLPSDSSIEKGEETQSHIYFSLTVS